MSAPPPDPARRPRYVDGIPRCSEHACGRFNLRGTCTEMNAPPRELCEPEIRALIALGRVSAREGLDQANRIRELEQGARAVAAALEVLGDGADQIDRTALEPQNLGNAIRDRALELQLLATGKAGRA